MVFVFCYVLKQRDEISEIVNNQGKYIEEKTVYHITLGNINCS